MIDFIIFLVRIYLTVGFILILFFDLNVLMGKASKREGRRKLAKEVGNKLNWHTRTFIFFAWPLFLGYFKKG